MKHIFSLEQCAPGQWLFGAPGVGDCAVRVGTSSGLPVNAERICVLLKGELSVIAGADVLHGDGEAAFFIPAQAECRVEAGVGALFLEMFVTPGSPAGRAIQFSLAPTELQGKGFAWKSLIDRSNGSTSVRANLVQVQPGAGSPDRHIHLFDQFYLVLEGEMRVEVGRREMDAGPLSFVVLPAGCVHRNWNASKNLERHIAFLVPEPVEGQIFDYAVDVHEREAELMGPR